MKKNKDVTRSIRINKDLLKKAKQEGININGLVSLILEELLDGKRTCPVCGNRIKN